MHDGGDADGTAAAGRLRAHGGAVPHRPANHRLHHVHPEEYVPVFVTIHHSPSADVSRDAIAFLSRCFQRWCGAVSIQLTGHRDVQQRPTAGELLKTSKFVAE